MDIGAVIAKIQGLNLEIDGVRSAPTRMPGTLDTIARPCTLVYPARAEHGVPYYQGRKAIRNFLVRLYVQPLGQGEGVDDGYQKCLPFLDRFANQYHRLEVIAPSDEVWQLLTLLHDSGVLANMTLHGSGVGQVYWGVEFTLQIKTKEEATS